MTILRFTGATLVLALAACTTPTQGNEAAVQAELQAANEAGLICQNEKIPGSLRRERVCRTQAEIERSRAEAFQETDRIQRGAPGPSGG